MPRIKKPNFDKYQPNERILLFVLIIPLIVILFSCSILGAISVNNQWGRVNFFNDKQNTDTQNAELYTITATAINSNGAETVIELEVAKTEEELAYGLMNRSSMKEDHGMIFVFNEEANRTFWMKNTYIPLDIAFLDKNKQIINIYANATPLNTQKTYSSSEPAMYVIEMNAFWFGDKDISEGDLIKFTI